MIKFRCNECQHKIAVPNDYEGRYVKCPSCGAPTLVKHEPIEVQTTEAARSPVTGRTAVATHPASRPTPSRQAPPLSSSRLPEARPVRTPPAPTLSGSQASELVRAIGEADDAGVDEQELLSSEGESVSKGLSSVTTSRHHVPHVKPPHYSLLSLFGVLMLCFAGIGAMLWLVALILVLAGSEAIKSIQSAGILIVATLFVSGLLVVLMLAGAGAALLAMRDMARHSWYLKETAALLRQL